MLSKIIHDSDNVKATFDYRVGWNIDISLSDEAKALKKPERAYYFARNVQGANIEKCQEIACQLPMWAYFFYADVPGADFEKCREAVSKSEHFAKCFRHIPRKVAK